MPDTFYWVRSIKAGGGKERILMIYKGTKTRRDTEGWPGDIQCRPAHLGDGEYTVTVGRMDCETLQGNRF